MDTFTKEELYITEVSFWDRIYRRTDSCVITIKEALDKIKNEEYKNQIDKIREYILNRDKESAKKTKNQLPCVTFAGKFKNTGKIEDCEIYNYLLILDIDKVSDIDMPQYQTYFQQDQYVIAFWKSPSGNGWKGIIPLEKEGMEGIEHNKFHFNAFIQIEKYFLEKYNIQLDKSGKDISRQCYLSSDSNIVIKDQCLKFKIDTNNLVEHTIHTRPNDKKPPYKIDDIAKINLNINTDWNHLNMVKPESHNKYRHSMDKIVKYLEKKHLSITYNYEQWVGVAFAIATTFHKDYGRKIFLRLCRLDADKHNEFKSDKLLYKAYTTNRGERTFGTILQYAEQKGWIVNAKGAKASCNGVSKNRQPRNGDTQ